MARLEEVSFNILKKNSKIGFVNIKKRTSQDTIFYLIDSEVNARVIFNFKATGKEKSIYVDDQLVFSSMFRKINNRVKLDQYLSLINGKYFSHSEGEKAFVTKKVIKYNLVTLFFKEPHDFNQVYSDKYKQWVHISSLGDHRYKITLPNNSTSIYHYINGICKTVELEGTFYKVRLVRTMDSFNSLSYGNN